MDFLKDLLPLLIIGVVYLVGAIGKNKKKPAPQQAPQPADEEVRDVVLKPTQTKKVQKKAQPNKKKRSPFLSHELRNSYEKLPDYEPILEEEEEQLSSLPDFQDPEEMRKAVIYSEILSRKF